MLPKVLCTDFKETFVLYNYITDVLFKNKCAQILNENIGIYRALENRGALAGPDNRRRPS